MAGRYNARSRACRILVVSCPLRQSAQKSHGVPRTRREMRFSDWSLRSRGEFHSSVMRCAEEAGAPGGGGEANSGRSACGRAEEGPFQEGRGESRAVGMRAPGGRERRRRAGKAGRIPGDRQPGVRKPELFQESRESKANPGQEEDGNAEAPVASSRYTAVRKPRPSASPALATGPKRAGAWRGASAAQTSNSLIRPSSSRAHSKKGRQSLPFLR